MGAEKRDELMYIHSIVFATEQSMIIHCANGFKTSQKTIPQASSQHCQTTNKNVSIFSEAYKKFALHTTRIKTIHPSIKANQSIVAENKVQHILEEHYR